MWSLLTYMIVNRDREIPPHEFWETLWPEDQEKSQAGALKTLFFRVRKMLVPVFGAEAQVILSQRGAYYWNPEIQCDVDIESFEKCIAEAESPKIPDARKLALYARATALYKGDFLPRLQDQAWTVPARAKYQALYGKAARAYAGLLHNAGRFAEAEMTCIAALQADALDEKLYMCLLRALLSQGKHIIAMGYYEAAADALRRHGGMQPSSEFRDLYNVIARHQEHVENDLGSILDGITEKERNAGAFICDFNFFENTYRLTARQARRDKISVYIALLTVSAIGGGPLPLLVLGEAMTQLSEGLSAHLRRGDVITRYSGAQYLALLPRAGYEDGVAVMERVLGEFGRHRCAELVRVQYKLQEMEPDRQPCQKAAD